MISFKDSYPLLLAVALVLGGGAGADPRRVVLASGDCKDAELSGQTRALYGMLAARPGETVLTPADFTERLFPQPTGSHEEIQRKLAAAQDQFYEAHYGRATQAVDEVLKQVARLPVGEARWKLFADAWLLQAMTLRALGRPARESEDAFGRVLRVNPGYPLNSDDYTPSTRQAFEKVRHDLAQAPQGVLSVKSTLPSSEVFLEGHGVGSTPLVLKVPPGSYELSVKKGDTVSIAHQIIVQGKETPVLVDLAYEGAIQALPFPCLASSEGGERTFSHAIRLGGTLGMEEVIVVRLERASSGPKWLAATVLNVEGGQKLREGGFKTQGLDAPADSLSALVDFITTGKAQPSVVVTRPDLQPPWEKVVAPVPALTAPPPSSARPLRAVSWVTLGAGTVALAGAGIVRLSAEQDWTELRRGHLKSNGQVSAEDARGVELVHRLASKGQLVTGLLIGSGAALATGAVLFLASSPPAPVSVGVTAGPDGAGASLSGSF